MMKKRHVLIAEDDSFLSGLMKEVLEKYDMNVSIAMHGGEALEIIRTNPPDLLLLDILMPIVDGYAVLETLKKDHAKFPVLVITNLSDEKTQKRATEAGASDFIVKSDIDDEDLWAIVQKFLPKQL